MASWSHHWVHIKLQGIHLFVVSLQQLEREVDDGFLLTRLGLFVLDRLTVYFLMMFCRKEKFVLLQVDNLNNLFQLFTTCEQISKACSCNIPMPCSAVCCGRALAVSRLPQYKLVSL